MTKGKISVIIFLCTCHLLLAAYAPKQEAVDSFAANPKVPAASVAVYVSDIQSGEILGKFNAGKSLVPASIMKCVSNATLARHCDVDKPWITDVLYDGDIDGAGILHGNITVIGSGDPSLGSRVWPESPDILTEITQALKNAGINRVEGRLITDQSVFSGSPCVPSWGADDLRQAYGTGCHGLNYANNASGSRSVADPAAQFRQALTDKLQQEGIVFGNASVANDTDRLLVRHNSAPIKEIMRSCMMRSDNLFAEAILRRAGLEQGGDGSTADAAHREKSYWEKEGLKTDGIKIADGSGLSRSNRVTAKFMSDLLTEMAGNVEYASFFPLAGQEGTLKKFLAGTHLDSYVALKTGSMRGIQCYAGYKLNDDFAPTHTIVVIVNNFTCDRAPLRSAIERMLLEIFPEP